MPRTAIFLIFLFLLIPGTLRAGDLDWAFPHVPDDCRLVAGCNPGLFKTSGLDTWLQRVFPAAHESFQREKPLLDRASAFLLAVPAGEGTDAVLFLGMPSLDTRAWQALQAGLNPGEILQAVPGGILKGQAQAVGQLKSRRNGRGFASIYRRFKAPLFWLSLPLDETLRRRLATLSSLKDQTNLLAWLPRLQRLDAVVHRPDHQLHLTLNLELQPPAGESLDQTLTDGVRHVLRWLAGKERQNCQLPPFSPVNQLSLQARRHSTGLIVDLAPFPDALLELYLYAFHRQGKLELSDRFALAALCQLLMRFDGAAAIYHAADREVRHFYDRKIQSVLAAEENARRRGDRAEAQRFRREGSEWLTRKNRQLASLTDLCLLNLYLAGKNDVVARTLRLAGKNATLMYPHCSRLVNIARRPTVERSTPPVRPAQEMESR